jgi:parvulin-like peptidyl-prolyl isomerase
MAFQLEERVVAEPFAGPTGQVIYFVSGKRDSYLPTLEEAQSSVRDHVITARAAELAKERATKVAAQLKGAADFQAAAKAAGLEAVTSQPLAREAVIPNIGLSPEIDAVAFSLPIGGVSDAIPTPQGAAIVKVTAKQDVTPAGFAMARDQFRVEMLAERRAKFYQAYMEKAREKMKIEIDAEAMKRVIGT